VEAREVGDGDDVGGEGAPERLAAEVVQQELLVGGAEAEADGQPREGPTSSRLPQPPRRLHSPNARSRSERTGQRRGLLWISPAATR
jgi:hypothetical protein